MTSKTTLDFMWVCFGASSAVLILVAIWRTILRTNVGKAFKAHLIWEGVEHKPFQYYWTPLIWVLSGAWLVKEYLF